MSGRSRPWCDGSHGTTRIEVTDGQGAVSTLPTLSGIVQSMVASPAGDGRLDRDRGYGYIPHRKNGGPKATKGRSERASDAERPA